jgi:hypothetical protein
MSILFTIKFRRDVEFSISNFIQKNLEEMLNFQF